MDTLVRLLSSRVKAETLRLLFGPASTELHVREIARRARLNDATVRQELKRLAGLGVVVSRRDGNRVYFRANTGHPLYPDLRNLVLKTSGLADVLRQALGKAAVRVAFVFGSLAQGDETAESDVDLMVVGAVSLRQVAGLVAGASAQLGREVNSYVLSPREFAARGRARDHFLASVLDGPKVFVIGDDDELAAVAR